MARSPTKKVGQNTVTKRAMKTQNENTTKEKYYDQEDNNVDVGQVLRKIVDKINKNTTTRSRAIRERSDTLYARARTDAKEIVKAGSFAADDIYSNLREFRDKEITFDKYHKDLHLPALTEKKTFETMDALYLQMFHSLGIQRAHMIDAVNEMLKDNPTRRRESLRACSKSARLQLEDAKQREKDASDATALIKHVKGLLRL